MIISNNRAPLLGEFCALVERSNDFLNQDALRREKYYLSRHAQKLEDDVVNALNITAKGTVFENTIVKVSGQKFPDIVANKYYGVEVKSSKDESWTTLGGSVNESTRVNGVERIFLTFGKLYSPIEFKSRPYEDCLSEVVVTHYPRYKINMTLPKGNTIFDKMGTTYDELRSLSHPVGKIVSYYKSRLKKGERLWWIDSSENDSKISSSMTVKLWRTLPIEDKTFYMLSGLAFFPDVISSKNTKYENFSLWLVSKFGVISTSMRDTFSAGGKESIITPNKTFENLPQIIGKIHKNSNEIKQIIVNAHEEELLENWGVSSIYQDRIGQWIDIVSKNYSLENYDIKTVLSEIFSR